MLDCVFCKIIRGEIGELIDQTENFVVFKSIEPKTKIHLLIVPKKHITGLYAINSSELIDLSELFPIIQKMAKKFDLKSGCRLVCNQGSDAGQSVPHLHFHLLGGEKLSFSL